MKDYTREELEAFRPEQVDAEDAIEFCLRQLDWDMSHEREDEIVAQLTFEELIGALLLALDAVRRGYEE